jgi:hypothetical protein
MSCKHSYTPQTQKLPPGAESLAVSEEAFLACCLAIFFNLGGVSYTDERDNTARHN